MCRWASYLPITGKQIKTNMQTINTTSNRSSEVTWNGRDVQDVKVGRGVYLYYLQVRTAGSQQKGKWARLVFLN
jgi:spore germination protein GerM